MSDLMGAESRRVILLRHGRTAWNVERRYQGQADVPLDDVGLEQAEEIVVSLANLAPSRIVSSDLQRARSTVAPTAAKLGLPVTLDRRLREIDVGRWQGLLADEAEARFPAEFARWQAGEPIARSGGETRAACGQRVSQAILEHARTTPTGGALLVTSHGLAIGEAVARLRDEGRLRLTSTPPHLHNATWLDLHLTVTP